MKHITNILIREGFKSYRYIYNKGNFSKDYNSKIKDFTTMVEGGLDIRYEKDNNIVIYGLHEYGKPPTLITPRPKIIVKGNWIDYLGNERTDDRDQTFDDAMNICLQKENHEDIFIQMFKREKTFIYNV